MSEHCLGGMSSDSFEKHFEIGKLVEVGDQDHAGIVGELNHESCLAKGQRGNRALLVAPK